MPARSKFAADSQPVAKELASARHVAAVIRTCLQEGHRVEIERVGEFRPVCGGGFRFVPERRPSVFLAYVREDATKVECLCEITEAAGFDARMDCRKLLLDRTGREPSSAPSKTLISSWPVSHATR